MATNPGILNGTNDQAELTVDNQLVVQLYNTENPDGFFVDDVLRLVLKWLNSLQSNPDRADAAVLMKAALLLLDKSAVERHGYNFSTDERDADIDFEGMKPSDEDWARISSKVKAFVGKPTKTDQ